MKLTQPLTRISIWGQRLIIIACVLLCLSVSCIPAVQASIHTYPETETATMYRSRLSLQDDHGLAWQAILFKRSEFNRITEFNLRLVGFPGQIVMQHPANLQIRQAQRVWSATDRTSSNTQLTSVAETVGEYDVMEFMRTLDSASRLEILLEVDRADQRSLIVPKSMVKEWLALREKV